MDELFGIHKPAKMRMIGGLVSCWSCSLWLGGVRCAEVTQRRLANVVHPAPNVCFGRVPR